MKRTAPIESLALPGMTQDIEHQAEAAAEYSGEQLTAKMREALADVSKMARQIETDAPLFYGTIHPTLF